MIRKLVPMRQAIEDRKLLGAALAGDTWANWRVLLIASAGEPLTDDEMVAFKELTGRDKSPAEPVSELACVVGRRGGKSRAAGVLAAWLSGLCSWKHILAPGERGFLPVLAVNQAQAGQAFRFIRGVFEMSPMLSGMIEKETADTLSLTNSIDIRVQSASFRSIRGITAIGAIADERLSTE